MNRIGKLVILTVLLCFWIFSVGRLALGEEQNLDISRVPQGQSGSKGDTGKKNYLNPGGPINNYDDSEIKLKARRKVYPGGRDEESLRVQSQMVAPTRKMAPTVEAPEAASNSAED